MLTIPHNITILSITISIIILTTWILFSINNPINLILLIITITLSISVIISLNISSWFALIIVLIYIGGIMVIFSYFISLSSNDTIISKGNLHYILVPTILVNSSNLELTVLTHNTSQISNLYASNNTIILLIILTILISVIIIITNIVNINNYTLRGFNQL